jgi:hypothetical protein
MEVEYIRPNPAAKVLEPDRQPEHKNRRLNTDTGKTGTKTKKTKEFFS